MVQSVLHHLDPKPLSRTTTGAVRPQLSHKPVIQTKVSCTENKCLNSGKGRAIKLNPLHVPAQNKECVVSSENKCQSRSNAVPQNHLNKTTGSKSKGFPSKIPVLKKPLPNTSRRNDEAHCDPTLSAADKRQKFHQSRLRVAPACNTGNSSFHFNSNSNKLTPYDFVSWYDVNKIHAVHSPYPATIFQSQKLVLPPVKDPLPASGNEPGTSQGNKTNLLGEITHFPALCNVGTAKMMKKPNVSSVPHLPPIHHQPPAPPPPSISSSLEKNVKPSEDTGNVKKLPDRNASKPVIFQMLIPVGLR